MQVVLTLVGLLEIKYILRGQNFLVIIPKELEVTDFRI